MTKFITVKFEVEDDVTVGQLLRGLKLMHDVEIEMDEVCPKILDIEVF